MRERNGPDLRLVVITDRDRAGSRGVAETVRLCLEAGAPAIQLRAKDAAAAELLEMADQLRALTREHHALLFINDRLDVALAAGADGVHLGPHDLPVPAARRAAPAPFLIGYSADDAEEARCATREGADYIGCGAVYGTRSKDVGEEHIGPEGLERVVDAVQAPVLGIGGVDEDNVAAIAGAGAAGAAVLSAIMGAEDPGAVVRRLLAAFD